MTESQDFLKTVKDGIAGLEEVRRQISQVIVGQSDVIDLVLIALLCEGHVLLEGVPGLGKTMLVRTLADCMALQFSRIQFTPDLMPADVIGTSMVFGNEQGGYQLRFEPGPVFANLVLGDEINRASPKTQSALLEAMQERTVTVRGKQHPLPRPFLVLATQNPLEMEGTYPLPEAQTDRFFFKILVRQPNETELISILERTVGSRPALKPTPIFETAQLTALQRSLPEVVVPAKVTEYVVRLVLATQPEQGEAPERVKQYVRYGSGPRGAQTLILAGKAMALLNGRFNVSLDDIRTLVAPALRHRIALNFDGQSDGIQVDDLLEEIFTNLPMDRSWPSSVKL